MCCYTMLHCNICASEYFTVTDTAIIHFAMFLQGCNFIKKCNRCYCNQCCMDC